MTYPNEIAINVAVVSNSLTFTLMTSGVQGTGENPMIEASGVTTITYTMTTSGYEFTGAGDAQDDAGQGITNLQMVQTNSSLVTLQPTTMSNLTTPSTTIQIKDTLAGTYPNEYPFTFTLGYQQTGSRIVHLHDPQVTNCPQ